MTTTVLLDPAIVLEAKDEPSLSRLLTWTADHRVKLGIRAWNHLADLYSNGSLDVPRVLAKMAHEGIGTLLSRSPIKHSVHESTATAAPAYHGAKLTHTLLVDDLVGTSARDGELFLGTHESLWAETPTTVACVPPPPTDVAVHLEPNLPSLEERRAATALYFKDRRILIVGGQIEIRVVEAMTEQLGIPADRINWIASEKNKRARNLKATIGGLPKRSIVVCVVGKVGHDVSGDVEKHSNRDGITLRVPRFASQIVDDLITLSDKAASTDEPPDDTVSAPRS